MLQFGPFQGITDVWFRRSFMRFFQGIDKFYTPFFGGIHSLQSKHFASDELKPELNHCQSLVPQLLTNKAAELERFAYGCHAIGYSEINLNMGCPWPQVTSKKHGCGLMPYPSMVKELLNPLKNLPTKVSVKCRLGLENPDEICYLLPIFEQAGIRELIVHARTGKQLYKGEAMVNRFADILQKTSLPVVYNGDIFDSNYPNELQQLLPRLNGLMLGRGLLADPFLAADIKETGHQIDHEHRAGIVQQFLETLYGHRVRKRINSESIPGPMKELWWYLSHSFNKPVEVWRIIRKTQSKDEFFEAQAYIFDHYKWLGQGFGKKTAVNKGLSA